MKNIQEILSFNLKHLRKKRGLTQEEVSEQANIALKRYQNIEQGHRWPRPPALEAIAKALAVTPSQLLMGRMDNAGPTIEELTKIIERQEREIKELLMNSKNTENRHPIFDAYPSWVLDEIAQFEPHTQSTLESLIKASRQQRVDRQKKQLP